MKILHKFTFGINFSVGVKNTPSSSRVEFHLLLVPPARYTRVLDYPIVVLMFYADDRKEQISLRNVRQGIVLVLHVNPLLCVHGGCSL